MKRFLLILCLLTVGAVCASAQKGVTVSGTVLSKTSGAPVEFATVILERSGQWSVADAKGVFKIAGVQPGKDVLVVSCLGFVDEKREITITKDVSDLKIVLLDDNLALESAVVTATENSNSATTSRLIDRAALDHVQVMNVSDISSLLPGGSTTNPLLTSDQQFNIRGGSSEAGNSSFGTAVEVDGVRLSSNASFAGASASSTSLKGVSTNNIASSNIESVEVITGVPSVEYGDMTSGVVKINTRKGKTPYTVTMSTSPNTKQLSFSKGFGLGNGRHGASRGVLNTSAEYARSVSNQMSPYTSYDRRQVSLIYSNTFSSGIFAGTPLRFSTSVTGNLGGLDDSADPDKFLESYSKAKDNALRANLTADLLLSKPWITNIEFTGSAAYSDKLSRTNTYYNSSSSTSVLHQTGMEYVMADQIPAGYWYNVMVLDDKPMTVKLALKANWAHNFGKANNKVKVGGDWTADKNYGVGQYSEDMATAPTYREYCFRDIPMMSNLAAYIEDNLMLPVGREGRLNLIAGVRNDNTIIPGSAYGLTSSVSPRFNAKYTVLSGGKSFLKELSFRGSWGLAVKLPSYSILYPVPSYVDLNVFTSTSSANNMVNRAFLVLPRTIEYNPELRWQRNRQSEIGMDMNLGGTKISLSGYYNLTEDSFRLVSDYDGVSYSFTNTTASNSVSIPSADRRYSIDPHTGVVTVSDVTGKRPDEVLPSKIRHQFQPRTTEDNDDTPITRYGLEWVVDFKKIAPINTTIRVDGNYYVYKMLYTDMRAYSPHTLTGSDGEPFKYIGYYYGDNKVSNGSLTKALKTNLTATTNIPAVRMVVSVKLEASLLKYSQYLSSRDGKDRSFTVANQSEVLSTTGGDIYAGDSFAVMYPDTYSSIDDPTPKDYMEALKWAKTNDKALYSDLSKLAVMTGYTYYFKPDRISPYFSANFSVTKEIGDMASISFYANNFFNNMSQLHSSRTDNYVSVTSYIPSFYYGLTLRLKF